MQKRGITLPGLILLNILKQWVIVGECAINIRQLCVLNQSIGIQHPFYHSLRYQYHTNPAGGNLERNRGTFIIHSIYYILFVILTLCTVLEHRLGL